MTVAIKDDMTVELSGATGPLKLGFFYNGGISSASWGAPWQVRGTSMSTWPHMDGGGISKDIKMQKRYVWDKVKDIKLQKKDT